MRASGSEAWASPREFLAEKYYRDAKIGTIYEGTSSIQLMTITVHRLARRRGLHQGAPSREVLSGRHDWHHL